MQAKVKASQQAIVKKANSIRRAASGAKEVKHAKYKPSKAITDALGTKDRILAGMKRPAAPTKKDLLRKAGMLPKKPVRGESVKRHIEQGYDPHSTPLA